MRIELTESEDSYDMRITHDLDIFDAHGDKINGVYIGNSEPEDCIIGRDLINGHDIIKYIQWGYDAGKNGEELDIIYKEEEKED